MFNNNVLNNLETKKIDVDDNTLTLLLIGDIMLGEDFTRFKQEQGLDYEYPFEKSEKVFADADIVFGNFEGTLSKRGPLREKGPNLYSPPECISALKYLNFSVVSLGNNHINDFGVEGIIETMKIRSCPNFAERYIYPTFQ